jgi:hypothetical protein
MADTVEILKEMWALLGEQPLLAAPPVSVAISFLVYLLKLHRELYPTLMIACGMESPW